MGKLGRKICCNFDKDVKCLHLVGGNKMCFFDETTEEQLEMAEFQLGVCPLLPTAMRDYFLAYMKKECNFNRQNLQELTLERESCFLLNFESS